MRQLPAICVLLPALFGGAGLAAGGGEIRFSNEIQPLFAEKCLECHGPDKQKGGLRLDSRESLLKEQESGHSAVVPGNLDRSGIIRWITSDDPDGYEKDAPRPDAWHYRTWVLNAVSDDMPMDQCTIEQLAGDLLPGATPGQRLATAFHRQTLTNTEGGTDQEEFRNAAVFDRTETTGTIWLWLTMNCARCHTHKYDAIPHSDYYRLFAFTMLMAGGGIKGGRIYGQTDEFGWHPIENPVHINDLHATMLHCFGLEHEKLTYRFQGRVFRITDVGGKVIPDWLA